MRIEISERNEKLSYVTVTTEEITAAIFEKLSKAQDAKDHKEARYAMRDFCNSIARCLHAVTPEMIEILRVDERQVVAERLREEASKFHDPATKKRKNTNRR